MNPSERFLVKRKLHPPLPPDHPLSRPRLDRLVLGLIGRHRIVLVCATAGAGKSTSVAQALAADTRPVAWLSVDDTDVSPGRLLTYLQAAVIQALPGISAAADRGTFGRHRPPRGSRAASRGGG